MNTGNTRNDVTPIRGHHLICMLTYMGEGYSKEFVENMNAVVRAIHEKRALHLVGGADQICRCCNSFSKLCVSKTMFDCDKGAVELINTVLNLEHPWTLGSDINLSESHIVNLRSVYLERLHLSVCDGCRWLQLCRDCAQSGFKNVRLFGQQPE